MRTHLFRSLFWIAASLLLLVSAYGQDNRPQTARPADQEPPAANAQDSPANLLRQLNLSREQVQQVRNVNLERKPLLAEAQRRFREANRSLDEAIYSDKLDETEVQARLKEVQLAQAELAKVRYANELSVRKILTPEQLVHFRDLRQKFEQERLKNRAAAAGPKNIAPAKPVNALPFQNPKRQRPVGRPTQQHP
jgi:Spy/CpxP family protein refolding chaperone